MDGDYLIMAGRPATFRQCDIARAIKGAEQAGMVVGAFEVRRDGTIVVMRNAPQEDQDEQKKVDPPEGLEL